MKNFIKVFVTVLLFGHYNAFSQWTNDPANPMVTASAANVQSNVQSFPDGDGGLFSFWKDSRNESGKFDVFGQHYNADGIAQWTENGKLIINGLGNVQSFHIIPTDNGEILIAWIDFIETFSPDNGIFAQKLNANGETVWPSNLLMKTGSALMGVSLVESAGNYYSCMQALVTGGADKIYMNKFTENGTLLWPIDEYNITYNTWDIGRVSATSDKLGGIYVYYSTGNGSGAALLCNHLNTSSGNLWSDWINVTSGSPGLNYQFSAIGDSQGVTLVWVGDGVPNTSGKNIYSRRLLISSGDNAWSGGTKEISVAMSDQDRFYWKKSGDDYYMTWSDSRSLTNADIYAQKFNTSGEMFWDQDGIEVANLSTYIPYPEFDLNADNSMVIGHKALYVGFVAHKVLSDGTVEWGPDGDSIFISEFSPFYSDFNIVYTGDKFLAISARTEPSGGADGIYISQIDVRALSVAEYNDIPQFGFYPNPVKDFINITGISELSSVQIFDITGKILINSKMDSNSNSLDLSLLSQGIYLVKINNRFAGKLVKK